MNVDLIELRVQHQQKREGKEPMKKGAAPHHLWVLNYKQAIGLNMVESFVPFAPYSLFLNCFQFNLTNWEYSR